MARFAQKRGGDAGVESVLADLLVRHGCMGARALLTSAGLKDTELNLLDPSCPVYSYAPHVPADVLDGVAAHDGGPGQKYKFAVADITIDDGDCTLIAAAEASDDLVRLVTDDLDLFDVLCELLGMGKTGIWPKRSIDLLVDMYECEALDFDDLETLSALEDQHYATYPIHPDRRQTKRAILKAALNRGVEMRVRRETSQASDT